MSGEIDTIGQKSGVSEAENPHLTTEVGTTVSLQTATVKGATNALNGDELSAIRIDDLNFEANLPFAFSVIQADKLLLDRKLYKHDISRNAGEKSNTENKLVGALSRLHEYLKGKKDEISNWDGRMVYGEHADALISILSPDKGLSYKDEEVNIDPKHLALLYDDVLEITRRPPALLKGAFTQRLQTRIEEEKSRLRADTFRIKEEQLRLKEDVLNTLLDGIVSMHLDDLSYEDREAYALLLNPQAQMGFWIGRLDPADVYCRELLEWNK